MSALTFELARQRYVIRGATETQRMRLVNRFGELRTKGNAGRVSTIHLATNDDAGTFMKRPPGPSEYRLLIQYDAARLRVSGIGFHAEVERTSLDAHMTTCHEDDWFLDGFENLFRVVACYRAFEAGAVVLHSAAFTDGARGFLCCGRSGAGKTTLSCLADQLGLTVLSDELNLVSPTRGRLEVEPMPFAGDFGRARVGGPRLPLSALLGLRHGPAPRIGDCSRAEAVSRIVASCPYLNADPVYGERVTDRATDLAQRIPLRVLSFAPDTSFWQVLDHEYADAHHALPS